jgi:hypothetical protein
LDKKDRKAFDDMFSIAIIQEYFLSKKTATWFEYFSKISNAFARYVLSISNHSSSSD